MSKRPKRGRKKRPVGRDPKKPRPPRGETRREAEARVGYEGFKHLKKIEALLRGLRDESNPQRNLHFDYYVTWLLFYFFNPTLQSLRGLQAASTYAKVRRKLNVPRASLGSLSAAQHVFDHEELKPILSAILDHIPPGQGPPELRELREVVTVADGTLLRALPRVAWALWVNDEKRAAKAHVQFEILKASPSAVDVTAANVDEKVVFARRLEAGRFYVLDSGYAKLKLFQEVIDAKSNFVCRLPTNWTYEVQEERELDHRDRKARVIRDTVVKLGAGKNAKHLKRPVRLIEVEKVEEPSKRMRREREVRETIVLVTDRLDLSAEVIALLYSARWKIEIFFRWLKCTLGCKKLLAESENGAALQVYSALIACLLISLWLGKKPTLRVYEAICLYLQGWADLEDVLGQARRLKPHET